jgi:pimeloyl-ACP methyl ester carboxylesterase
MIAPAPQITARRLELADGTVSYFCSGQGRPTLFLHSAGEAARWLPLHDRLSAVAEVIAPDHPGFGESTDFPALRSVSDLAPHYTTILDEFGLERVDVVGVSFGGWVAAEPAARAGPGGQPRPDGTSRTAPAAQPGRQPVHHEP